MTRNEPTVFTFLGDVKHRFPFGLALNNLPEVCAVTKRLTLLERRHERATLKCEERE